MNIQPLLPANIQNLVSLNSWPTGNTAEVLQRQLQQQLKIRFEIEKILKTKNENEKKSLFENLYNYSSSMTKELLKLKKMNQDKHFDKEEWNKKAYFAFTLNSILAMIALNFKMDFYKKQLQKERMLAYLRWRRQRLLASAAAEQDSMEAEREERKANKEVEQRLLQIENEVKDYIKKMDSIFDTYIDGLGLDKANKQQLLQIKNQHFQNIGQCIITLKLLTQEKPLQPIDHVDIARELEKTMHSFESFVDDSKKLILGAGKQIDHSFEHCINAMRHDVFQVVNKSLGPIIKQQPANQHSILTETFGHFKRDFESFEHAFGKVLGAYEHHHKTASTGRASSSMILSGQTNADQTNADIPKKKTDSASVETPNTRKSPFALPTVPKAGDKPTPPGGN